MSERKIPVSDEIVLARLERGATQQSLADEYGVSRRAIRLAADRQRALRDRVAAGAIRAKRERRQARRGTRGRKGFAPQPHRRPEDGPSQGQSESGQRPVASRRKASGTRIFRPILLDESFVAVSDSSSSDYARWLDERDAARTPAAIRAAERAEREEIEAHRQRVAAETGMRWDPLANSGHGAFVR